MVDSYRIYKMFDDNNLDIAEEGDYINIYLVGGKCIKEAYVENIHDDMVEVSYDSNEDEEDTFMFSDILRFELN